MSGVGSADVCNYVNTTSGAATGVTADGDVAGEGVVVTYGPVLSGAVISDVTGTTITVTATTSGDISSGVFGVEYSVLDNGGDLSGYTFSKNVVGQVSSQSITIGAAEGVTTDSTVTLRAYYNLDPLDDPSTRVYGNDLVPFVVAGAVPSGTQTEGETLTQVQGIIAGSSPITVTYQWQNDGGTGTWENINGATSATYVLQASDVNYDVAVVHTGTNSAGSDNARSAETGPIASAVQPILLAINDNAANGSTTFTDQSPSAQTITASGTAAYSTTNPPIGMTSSAAIGSGATDYLSIANDADFNFAAGNFTIEGFVRFTSTTGFRGLISGTTSSTADELWITIARNTTTLEWYASSANGSWNIASAQSFGTVSANTWYHFALVRNGNTWTPYLDGVAGSGVVTSSATLSFGAGAIYIGTDRTGATNTLNGNICSVRMYKGTAIYTSNFTPPTLPLPS